MDQEGGRGVCGLPCIGIGYRFPVSQKFTEKMGRKLFNQNFFCIRQKVLLKHLKILDYFTHFKKFLYSALINIDIICRKILFSPLLKERYPKTCSIFYFVVKTFDYFFKEFLFCAIL